MTPLAEALAAMTPEEQRGARKALAVLGLQIAVDASAKRPRRRPSPPVAMPADATPADVARVRARIEGRG